MARMKAIGTLAAAAASERPCRDAFYGVALLCTLSSDSRAEGKLARRNQGPTLSGRDGQAPSSHLNRVKLDVDLSFFPCLSLCFLHVSLPWRC